MIFSIVFYLKINYTKYVMKYLFLEIGITENLRNATRVFYSFRSSAEIVSAILEIFIMTFIIYKILVWLRTTRAWGLLRGVVVLAIFVLIAYFCKFTVILYIFEKSALPALIAIIVIFQDDIRTGLEHLGRQRVFSKLLPNINKFTKKVSEENLQEIVEASFAMSKVKTGALIVMEKNVSLESYERTGIAINGEVSRQLLINIFEKNTPLHDGAVLIVGNVIKAATCYLPLSHNSKISKDLGTRHRAAIGISEVSDAVTIVVSEETGRVSLCVDGKIIVMNDEKEMLRELFKMTEESD